MQVKIDPQTARKYC